MQCLTLGYYIIITVYYYDVISGTDFVKSQPNLNRGTDVGATSLGQKCSCVCKEPCFVTSKADRHCVHAPSCINKAKKSIFCFSGI